MGARGPARQSAEVLKLHGSKHAKDRQPKPTPLAGAPQCPPWLPDPAKAHWRKLVSLLKDRGGLAKTDAGVLASYCIALHKLESATAILEKEGRVFRTST